jgi:hypothetical protein
VVESHEEEDEAADINPVQGGLQLGNGRRGGQRGDQCGSQRGGQRCGQQGRGGQGGQSGSQQQGGSGGKALMPSEAAATATSICWYHWRFVENMSHCKGSAASPCGWQGN